MNTRLSDWSGRLSMYTIAICCLRYKVIPHMVERRLLSPAQAKKVSELSKQRKLSAILELLQERKVVGRLPTLCAALRSAGLPHIAQRLFHSEYLIC